MADAFDDRELAEADALDAEIGRVLAGAPRATADPVVTWLSVAIRTDPPPAVAAPVPRYSSESDGDEICRWVDEGGRFAPERFPVAAVALVTPAS